MAAEGIGLAAIVGVFAISQLGCSLVGRWSDDLVLCCVVFIVGVVICATTDLGAR